MNTWRQDILAAFLGFETDKRAIVAHVGIGATQVFNLLRLGRYFESVNPAIPGEKFRSRFAQPEGVS